MAAYTNYRRDPRVKREAEALVEAGHKVVFLARRQPGEPHRETISGVDVIKTTGLTRQVARPLPSYMLDYSLFFLTINVHLIRHPLRYRLIHINNMPDFLVLAAWLPRLLGRPVIHDVHDLMPELYVEKFASGERHWAVRAAARCRSDGPATFASAVLTVEDRLKDILSEPRRSTRQDPRADEPPGRPHLHGAEVDCRNHPRHRSCSFTTGHSRAVSASTSPSWQWPKRESVIPRLEFRIIGAGEERSRADRVAGPTRSARRRHVQ